MKGGKQKIDPNSTTIKDKPLPEMKQIYPFLKEGFELEKLFLSEKEKLNLKPQEHQIWIITQGILSLATPQGTIHHIQYGNLFFLPEGSSYILQAQQAIEAFRFRIPECLALCEYFFSPELKDKKHSFENTFNPVALTEILEEYVHFLQTLTKASLLNDVFTKLKIHELFFLLEKNYSEKEIAGLFYPILQTKNELITFVLENYKNIRTVEELATLNNRSIRNFEIRFKKTFGTSPGKWLLKRKIETVYHEIITTNYPLKIVADSCGFSTLSHMTDFCRKHMGVPPSTLRKMNNQKN